MKTASKQYPGMTFYRREAETMKIFALKTLVMNFRAMGSHTALRKTVRVWRSEGLNGVLKRI
jgi:hypothetical protein